MNYFPFGLTVPWTKYMEVTLRILIKMEKTPTRMKNQYLEKYWQAYQNVHRFVFDKMIHHKVGEWWPLLTRHGEPIWTHMSHNWKINYHTVRSMIETAKRMDLLLEKKNIDRIVQGNLKMKGSIDDR